MKENKSKILIVVGIIVALALVWVLFLRGSDEAGETTEPDVIMGDEENQTTEEAPDGTDGETAEPQNELVAEALAILGSYRDILAIQQEYTDSCPSEDVIADVGERFQQAAIASEALAMKLLAEGIDPEVATEAQPYQQEADDLSVQLATLGTEIAARCGIDITDETDGS